MNQSLPRAAKKAKGWTQAWVNGITRDGLVRGRKILSDSHWHVRYPRIIFLCSKMFPQHMAGSDGKAFIEHISIQFGRFK
jgi:hypothetical protein